MSGKNLALAEKDWDEDNENPSSPPKKSGKPYLIEKAAEKVSTDLDKVIHERLRLGIVSALAANETMSFNDLKTLLQTSDGNISVHARKLEEAGYVECLKSFKGRMPLTEYRITTAGRTALQSYLAHMESLIKAFRK